MKHNGNFTEEMRKTVHCVQKGYGRYYTRENFVQKLKELDYETRNGTSARRFREKELEKMCSAWGLDMGRLLDPDTQRRELKKVPNHDQLQREFLLELKRITGDFPTAADYMERLTRRLLKGEYEQDPVRLAILKTFLRQTGENTRPVLEEVRRRMRTAGEPAFTDAQRAEFAALGGSDGDLWLIDHMGDWIFDVLAATDAEQENRRKLDLLLDRVMDWEKERLPLPEKGRRALLRLAPGADQDLDPVSLLAALQHQAANADSKWKAALPKALEKAGLDPRLAVARKQLEGNAYTRFDLRPETAVRIMEITGPLPDTRAMALLTALQKTARDHAGDEAWHRQLADLLAAVETELRAHLRQFTYTREKHLKSGGQWLRNLRIRVAACEKASDPSTPFQLDPDTCTAAMKLLPKQKQPRTAAALLDQLDKAYHEDDPDWTGALKAVLEQVELQLRDYLYCCPQSPEGDAKAITGTWEDKFTDKEKKYQKPDWQLLRMAEDLAAGRFRKNGTTRKHLYRYAVVFDMRYYPAGATDYDENRDIVKNLFQDFYHDDLMRYVRDSSFDPADGENEKEPSGEGVNFKNFVEVIYLYYLARDTGLTPQEKLRQIDDLIDRCITQADQMPDRITQAPTEFTKVFRDAFEREILAIREPEALADYICAHYLVSPKKTASHIQQASRRNTADQVYLDLAQRLQTRYLQAEEAQQQVINQFFQQVLGFDWEPGKADRLHGGFRISGLLRSIDSQELDSQFPALLEKLDEMLRCTAYQVRQLLKGDPEYAACTRTKLITLYYCYFLRILDERLETMADTGIPDFPTLCAEFCDGDGVHQGVNFHLEQCGYQPMNEKNAFDMFVLFSIFLELMAQNDTFSPQQK